MPVLRVPAADNDNNLVRPATGLGSTGERIAG
jgi:hypothetical protein